LGLRTPDEAAAKKNHSQTDIQQESPQPSRLVAQVRIKKRELSNPGRAVNRMFFTRIWSKPIRSRD